MTNSIDLMNLSVDLTQYGIDNSELSDPNKWVTIQSEEYRPDKDAYIMERFHNDFPDLKDKVKDFDSLTRLASRSDVLNKWLVIASSHYVVDISPPKYLQGIVDPEGFIEIRKQLTNASKLNADKAQEEAIAAKEYKNKLDNIKVKYDTKLKQILDNKEVYVLSLTSQALPISMQIAIEGYTPAASSSAPNKKQYARELLLRYQQYLLNKIKENPKIDIKELVFENSVK